MAKTEDEFKSLQKLEDGNYSRDVFYFDWRNCTKFQQKLELLALIGFWNASFRQINRSSPSHYRQITVIFGIDSGSGQLPNSHKQKFSYKNFRKQKISLYFLKSSIFSSNFLFNIIYVMLNKNPKREHLTFSFNQPSAACFLAPGLFPGR